MAKKESGVVPLRVLILARLSTVENATIGDLSTWLEEVGAELNNRTVFQTMTRLAGEGDVKKLEDVRNHAPYKITAQGRKVLAAVKAELKRVMDLL